MRFFRMLAVVVLVTLCGGAFGGAVGGLLGYAVPESFNIFFGVHSEQVKSDAQRSEASESGSVHRLSAGLGSADSGQRAIAGAALGGAWGLILGAMIGIGLGVVDQFLLAFRTWLEVRRQTGSMVTAPGMAHSGSPAPPQSQPSRGRPV